MSQSGGQTKPSRARLPPSLVPMLARTSELPRDEAAWAYEVKWDGIRALVAIGPGAFRITTRNKLDVTSQYPELAALAEAIEARDAVLDGEIVAFDGNGRPSFQELQARLGVAQPSDVQRVMRQTPVTYIAFDLLRADGEWLMDEPYEERRLHLEEVLHTGPHWQVTPVSIGEGRAMLEACQGLELEGVVAKRLGSRYEPGKRSDAWRKVKLMRRQELVIGGWTPGQGGRAGRIGALLVGYHDPPGAAGAERPLRYAGKVGTGFTDAVLADLQARLAPLRLDENPFADRIAQRDAVFVEPVHVGEFEFTEWTRDGQLRHPSFKGLRFDKDPRDVVREES